MIFFSNKRAIPKQGEGVPHLGKIPTFSRFFFANVPYIWRVGDPIESVCIWQYFYNCHCINIARGTTDP